MRKKVPLWEKSNLTLEEAAAYSGILSLLTSIAGLPEVEVEDERD